MNFWNNANPMESEVKSEPINREKLITAIRSIMATNRPGYFNGPFDLVPATVETYRFIEEMKKLGIMKEEVFPF